MTDKEKIIDEITQEEIHKAASEYKNISQEDYNLILNLLTAFLIAMKEINKSEDVVSMFFILLYILEKVEVIKINNKIIIK